MVKPVSDGYDAWYIDQVLNICLARWLNPAIVPQMCRALEMQCERKRDRQVLMMLRKRIQRKLTRFSDLSSGFCGGRNERTAVSVGE